MSLRVSYLTASGNLPSLIVLQINLYYGYEVKLSSKLIKSWMEVKVK